MVGGKQAFEVSLADVSQTQLQGKNDVILEFHVDDTTGANEVIIPPLLFVYIADWFSNNSPVCTPSIPPLIQI